MIEHSISIGTRFGKWIIASSATKIYKNNHTKFFYPCICECGTKRYVAEHALKSNRSNSCGCSKSYFISKNRSVHGQSRNRIYNVWHSMNQRCYYKRHIAYHRYGGRGITVCDEWRKNFLPFFKWAMLNGYKDTLDIDRINNNGNYGPDNCRFVTKKINNNNRRDNIKR